MSSTESVEVKILASRAFLEELSLESDDRILLAFSGGPDSTALLCFLLEQFDEPHSRVALGYFNHRLRGKQQAFLESRHIAATADRFQLRLHCGEADYGEIARYAKEHRLSTEEAARILRYRFLRSIAEAGGYRYIATGHTGDDEIETLIQRFFQGSGVWGLCGIPRIAGTIIRPLLNWSRADVNAFNKRNHVEPFIDPSNAETTYLRNYIRHSLIPVAEEAFSNFEKSLKTLSLKMTLVRDYLDEAVSSRVQWRRKGDAYRLPAEYFASLHAIERIESVRCLVDSLGENEGKTLRIPFRSFFEIIELRELHDNAILFRGCGYRLQIHGDSVVFEPDIVFEKGKGYFKVINGHEGLGWSSRLPAVCLCITKNTGEGGASIPAAGIQYPLLVRSRREGDLISIGGITKDLKKMYNDWNVAVQDRWKIPVCEDRSGIIAVIGEPFGYKNVKRFSSAPEEKNSSYAFERC